VTRVGLAVGPRAAASGHVLDSADQHVCGVFVGPRFAEEIMRDRKNPELSGVSSSRKASRRRVAMPAFEICLAATWSERRAQ
jgi:hypothetical protein